MKIVYVRRLDVVHRGYSGYNSEFARYILPKIIEAEHSPKTKIKLTTVFFGANDATDEDNFQYVGLVPFEENIRTMTKMLLDIGSKVILVGPGPHDEIFRGELFPDGKNPRNIERNLEYSKVVQKVAKELDVAFIDLWHIFLHSVGWKEGDPLPGQIGTTSEKSIRHLLNDGLHFTGEGYRLWYDQVIDIINTKYPELIPANIPFQYPEFADVKIEDLKKL